MPRNRPHLSITLPRDFTFHYTEGEAPKTPEQDAPMPAAAPPPPQAYRVKRRNRPSIHSVTQTQALLTKLQNAPIPMIETPASEHEPLRPPIQHRATEPREGLLAPIANRPFMSLPRPRTPTMQRIQVNDYSCQTPPPKELGEEISRPLSRCSIISDSSDVSSGSHTSHPSMGGSCTSPESDAADPFVLPSTGKPRQLMNREHGLTSKSQNMRETSYHASSRIQKQPPVYWTAEMDKHLWSTYMKYLQDPTVTPFKTLPGSVPPLGVCHRVARQARKTWRGGQPVSHGTSAGSSATPTIADSPEAARSVRSGSSTPTGPSMSTTSSWPKSSSSTRRRLRLLAKKKPTIAPHYQRLLRSPSPFSSSQSRLARASSPLCQEQSAFNTRDIQFSLSTSTASTMQPDSYLAQLSRHTVAATYGSTPQCSDPALPWASPPAVPSSAVPSSAVPSSASASSDFGHHVASVDPFTEPSQLGSPFGGSHTWGPSRSRQHLRPSTPRAQSGLATSTIGPTLKSPLRFNGRNPYPSVSKRRAQHQLEDEMSPGGSDKRADLIEQLLSGQTEGRHRRVRSRGFSLGDVNGTDRLETLFQAPDAEQQMNLEQQIARAPSPTSNTLQPPDSGDSIRRLGSPFSISGGRSMPTRRPSRHLASASLSAFDPSNFASIDSRIRGADLSEDFLRKLRE
ncbi:MAG: hypothetical protein LQ346_004281 [Caloplaca aetnensis]|nr:MAG: hypothetical protein LQ346_004281 [Caloplaca aetnensis]